MALKEYYYEPQVCQSFLEKSQVKTWADFVRDLTCRVKTWFEPEHEVTLSLSDPPASKLHNPHQRVLSSRFKTLPGRPVIYSIGN